MIVLQPEQPPIVVEVLKQPQATRDISIDYILTMFATAGVFLLIAAVGGIIVGGIIVAIRRMRDASKPPDPDSSHVKLRLS